MMPARFGDTDGGPPARHQRTLETYQACRFMRQWGLKENPGRSEVLTNLDGQKWRRRAGGKPEGMRDVKNNVGRSVPGSRAECCVPPTRKASLGSS